MPSENKKSRKSDNRSPSSSSKTSRRSPEKKAARNTREDTYVKDGTKKRVKPNDENEIPRSRGDREKSTKRADLNREKTQIVRKSEDSRNRREREDSRRRPEREDGKRREKSDDLRRREDSKRREKEGREEAKRREKEEKEEAKRREKEEREEAKRREKEEREEVKRREKEERDEAKRREKEERKRLEKEERKRREKEERDERKRREKEERDERKRREKQELRRDSAESDKNELLSRRKREDTYEIHRVSEHPPRIRENTMDLDKPTSASSSIKSQQEVVTNFQQPLEVPNTEEEAYDYDDDDFEDYDDDDFEDESDEETDKKMDSGNYESYKLAREMAEVKAAMVRENSAANYPSRPSTEDQSHQDHHQNDQVQSNKRKPSGKVTVNFASAKQRQKSQIAAGKARKRGDELLTMIRLDIAKYDLFELAPIAYEALMAGQTNRVQATCQTGEDDLDEELQTDPIDTLEKWTQHPPPPLTSAPEGDVMQILNGVGGQMAAKSEFNHEGMKSINAARLSKFLESASQALITLLEEDAERKYGTGREGQEQKDVVFSEKVTLLDTEAVNSLSQRPVEAMSFAPDQPCLLLTAHGPIEDDFRSYLSIWNISSPSHPLHILVTSGYVRSVCFSPTKASMAFAGMMDGSISVWDLRESYGLHQEVVKVDFNDERIHRSPTFTTSSGEESSHDSAITGLKPLPEVSLEASYGDTFQIMSVEELGRVIIWTVLDSLRDSDVHLGLAHWGCVRIVNSVQMDLDCISASDVIFGRPQNAGKDSAGDLFVATGNGYIIHGSVHADHKPSPRQYKADLESNIGVRSLTFCPFGEHFILAGCDDGSVRLHSLTSEKPLITWPGTVDGQPIVQIIWSPSRPCVFYILDSDSRIHLWDLGVGDIYPAHTVQFEERVNVIGLNPELGDPRLKQMLALGMQNGRVEVHHLKADYRASDLKSCTKELDRFLHYVSII